MISADIRSRSWRCTTLLRNGNPGYCFRWKHLLLQKLDFLAVIYNFSHSAVHLMSPLSGSGLVIRD